MMPSCDQTGVPIHFHSSSTFGSTCLMSLRILLRVFPRQSPSSAILFEMSSDAGWPWLAPDFFMFFPKSSRRLFICRKVKNSRVELQSKIMDGDEKGDKYIFKCTYPLFHRINLANPAASSPPAMGPRTGTHA